MKKKWKIAIAGNPNSGKTTLFNALTGAKQTVGNWPGVTVERKVGSLDYKGKKIDVIDLPGIYSLSTSSRDEKIARDYILRKKPDVVVNIVDASNLERTLYLTIQLIEMKVPLVIVLNMIDMVKRKNLKIKIEQLTHLLDCPVVCTVAHKEEGIQAFKETIYRVLDRKHISSTRVHFPEEIEEAIAKIIAHLKLHHSEDLAERYDARWMAIKLLETDSDMEKIEQCPEVKELVAREQKKIEDIRGEETDIIIAEGRYGFINAMCKNVLDKTNIVRKDISDSIDKIALNRIFGIPLFLCAMYFVFWITINLGNCFIDFFDLLFGTLCVDGFGMFLMRIGVPSFMQTILADGIGGGIQTVSTFIPPIFFMFVCLAILEDSGYMARAAFIMDRSMKTIGLPGKAFVPLLVGFGCTVPAIMATRTLDNEKDRILTIMINPLMSCGARMPVYAVFAAVFFPESGDTIVFALYLVGIVLAVMTAFLLKGTILGGEPSSFIMELPPYHIPTIRGILIHTWERLKTFIIRAGKAIVFVVVLLSFLNSFGTDGSFGNQDSEHSVLSAIGKTLVPVFKPMGLRDENWPAAVGVFTGIFAKETVIGTLDALYSRSDTVGIDSEKDGEAFSLTKRIQNAFRTIPENLSHLSLPFSIRGLIGADVETAVNELEVTDSMYEILRKQFDGRVGAFAYLLMILLYMPCVASIAAVYRELNIQWTLFSVFYLSGLAWIVSTLFYQVMRFGQHPVSSFEWIVLICLIFAGFISVLKRKGKRGRYAH